MKLQPPQLAQRFFSWYCRNHLHDSILGDLDERFYLDLQKHSPRKAKIRYWLGVFSFISRFTLKRDRKTSYQNPHAMLMLKSNLIGSLRFLNRNKGFAFINILGLTIGMTSFLLILFFVNHELSFDNFHQNREHVFRVNFAFEDNSGNKSTLVNSPPAFAPGIRGKFPEMTRVSQMRYAMNCLLANGELSFYEDHGYYADSVFLEILKFDFSSGSPSTALDEPNSIVITKEMAKKYFGHTNAVGSTLILNNGIPLKVTGIMSTIPTNSHLNFDFLISFPTYVVPDGYASDLTSWDWLGFHTYVELVNQTDPIHFQEKLEQLFRDIHPEDDHPMQPIVQNLSDIYLGSSDMTDDVASHMRTGSRLNIYSLMAIAVLILIIAAFNFSNLSNAISVNRSKGTGIRKVIGAQRRTIMWQLLTETMVITLSCLVLAYGLSILLFPKIAWLMEWDLALSFTKVVSTLPIMTITAMLIGLSAGLYPALLLSRFNIIKSLKQELKIGSRNPFQFKNMLMLLQFSISIGLISATFVLTQQINYLRNRATGFDKNNVVVIKMLPEDMSRYFKVYKEQLMQYSAVRGISRSDRSVGEAWPFSGILRTDEGPEHGKMIFFNLTDHDYFKTMGIDVLDGRTFSQQNRRDSTDAVVINRKAATFLDLDNPVGQQVHFFDLEGPRTIIGVVENFNYTSLHQDIGPVAMVLPFIDLEYMYVRFADSNPTDNIHLLETTWEQISSGAPMESRFLDDNLNQLYKSEERLSYLIRFFSGLSIFLASLGLYGIVAFMINNRIKEFGIRKVLGASALSLHLLFVKQYVYQVLIAMTLVAPILHYYLNHWLQEFAYRIVIEWWVYPLSTLLLLVIALMTVIYQTIKAARENPSGILRSE
ncbi:ABC transporter permease [Reichenbachiella sp.]|uniref:ABC transporter permease n=1 Tax=Reichenbachiella sp. TaxID=2184521 RepID=UPI0032982ACC